MKDKIVMIHFNWIITLFEKEYRQREMLLYSYDDDNYYSSTNSSYFILHINDNNLKIQKKITLFGFHISIITGRKFIVPQYSCKFNRRNISNRVKNCTMADIFVFHNLYKLKHLFRENVFTIYYIHYSLS